MLVDFVAHARSGACRLRPRRGLLIDVPEPRAVVQVRLELEWGRLEQIAAWLRRRYRDRLIGTCVTEAIYQASTTAAPEA